MSILISVDSMPNRIRVLAEIVAAEKEITKDDLARRFAPGADNTQTFDSILRETRRLGLVTESEVDKALSLENGITKKQVSNRTSFIAHCRDTLIPVGGKDCPGNEAFPRALAWLLTRSISPNLLVGSEFQVELRKDLEGDEIFELTNASRSSVLVYWAQALGFVEWLVFKNETFCCPDPTRALAAILEDVLVRREQTPIAKFIGSLGDRLAVFETGHFRDEVEGRLKVPRDPNYLSQSTSLALRRLESSGNIKLDRLADAKTLLLSEIDGSDQAVSHVTLIKS